MLNISSKKPAECFFLYIILFWKSVSLECISTSRYIVKSNRFAYSQLAYLRVILAFSLAFFFTWKSISDELFYNTLTSVHYNFSVNHHIYSYLSIFISSPKFFGESPFCWIIIFVESPFRCIIILEDHHFFVCLDHIDIHDLKLNQNNYCHGKMIQF